MSAEALWLQVLSYPAVRHVEDFPWKQQQQQQLALISKDTGAQNEDKETLFTRHKASSSRTKKHCLLVYLFTRQSLAPKSPAQDPKLYKPRPPTANLLLLS